jgi:ribosomal protein S18 acetylase RimI-like enzyme
MIGLDATTLIAYEVEEQISFVITPGDIATVARLAREIWTAHYTPIIGAEQVDYMLGRFQNEDAIAAQITEGFAYFLVAVEGGAVGYAAILPEPDASLFLSKIYVHSSARGQGAGKALLDHIITLARRRGLSRIHLTVNRHNQHSIAWYLRQGFVKIGTKCQDIGNGFVMDDDVLVLTVDKRI